MVPQFVVSLTLGMAATWCLLPRSQVTSGYFRIQNLVILGLSVLGALMLPQWVEAVGSRGLFGVTVERGLLISMAIVAFISSVMWTLERRRSGGILAIVTLLLAIIALLGMLPLRATLEASPSTIERTLRIIAALTGAWSLGAGMATMLLGHWYLTATGMPITPIQRGTTWLGIAVVSHFIIMLLAVAIAPTAVREALLSSHLVWSLLRYIAGLAGPVVLVIMTKGTLKYRNTQSATGVLFACVILLFVGEAAALLLSRDLNWPL